MEKDLTKFQYCLFAAAFMLLVGCAIGYVFSYGEPTVIKTADAKYEVSPVNQAITEVKEQRHAGAFPVWAGVALMIGIFVANNLGIALILTYFPRYFTGWLGVLMVSFILFSNGFFAAMIFTKVLIAQGAAIAYAAFLPHGVFEFVGVIIAGGLGFLYLMGDTSTNDKKSITTIFKRWVIPLVVGAALLEVFVTPLIIYVLR